VILERLMYVVVAVFLSLLLCVDVSASFLSFVVFFSCCFVVIYLLLI